MRKGGIYIAVAGLLALPVGCEQSDVYYTDRYEVAEIRAQIQVEEDTTQRDEAGNILVEDSRVTTLRAEVEAEAPVRPGGSYTLHYALYNGGALEVRATSGAEVQAGSFIREPGASEMQFCLGADTVNYAMTKLPYEGVARTCLVADLTAEYTERHPDMRIKSIERREITTHE